MSKVVRMNESMEFHMLSNIIRDRNMIMEMLMVSDPNPNTVRVTKAV